MAPPFSIFYHYRVKSHNRDEIIVKIQESHHLRRVDEIDVIVKFGGKIEIEIFTLLKRQLACRKNRFCRHLPEIFVCPRIRGCKQWEINKLVKFKL
jgi:hypothetical protein